MGFSSTGFSLWIFLRCVQCRDGLVRVNSISKSMKTHRLKLVVLNPSSFFRGWNLPLPRAEYQLEQHQQSANRDRGIGNVKRRPNVRPQPDFQKIRDTAVDHSVERVPCRAAKN